MKIENHIIWIISRYWNRFAFFIIKIGKGLIWDYTGMNKDILKDRYFINETTKFIMCNYK